MLRKEMGFYTSALFKKKREKPKQNDEAVLIEKWHNALMKKIKLKIEPLISQ